jgi:hypothetical protein
MKETTETTEKIVVFTAETQRTQNKYIFLFIKTLYKRQKVKIITAQRNQYRLIQRKQIRESILRTTFPKHIKIRAFSLEKLGEKQKIRKHI